MGIEIIGGGGLNLGPWRGGLRILSEGSIDPVLAMERANLIAFWEFNGNAADSSGNARDATANNLTYGTGVGNGKQAGIFTPNATPALSSYVNAYSASLAAAFTGQEMTIDVMFKVSAAGVWTDGLDREIFKFGADAANEFRLLKQASPNGRLLFVHRSSATIRTAVYDTTSTGWLHASIVTSKVGNYVRFFAQGAQIGADQAVGTFTGSLAATLAIVGAFTLAPTNVWSGSIARVAMWNKPLTNVQIGSLYTQGLF